MYRENLIVASGFMGRGDMESRRDYDNFSALLSNRIMQQLTQFVVEKKLKFDRYPDAIRQGETIVTRVYVFTEDEFKDLIETQYRKGFDDGSGYVSPIKL